jgi:hypothetical protein
LIYRRFKVDMPIRTVGEYLKRWGFTPQKPLKKAYEQKPELVDAWLKESYPALRSAPRKKGQKFTGATKRASAAIASTAGAMRRQEDAGSANARSRFATNMISTVTNQGKVRFMLYEETMTAPVLIGFWHAWSERLGARCF